MCDNKIVQTIWVFICGISSDVVNYLGLFITAHQIYKYVDSNML